MRDFIAITKALADESRVRMLLALEAHELCVCQVVELVGLAPSTISKHLSVLKQARLIENRKNGRWVWYRIADSASGTAVLRAIAWARDSVAEDWQIRQDRDRLREILDIDPEELCKRRG